MLQISSTWLVAVSHPKTKNKNALLHRLRLPLCLSLLRRSVWTKTARALCFLPNLEPCIVHRVSYSCYVQTEISLLVQVHDIIFLCLVRETNDPNENTSLMTLMVRCVSGYRCKNKSNFRSKWKKERKIERLHDRLKCIVCWPMQPMLLLYLWLFVWVECTSRSLRR